MILWQWCFCMAAACAVCRAVDSAGEPDQDCSGKMVRTRASLSQQPCIGNQDEHSPVPPWSSSLIVSIPRHRRHPRSRGDHNRDTGELRRRLSPFFSSLGPQLALPLPFFLSASNPYLTKAYFTSAFDLSRQFLYEWTVNWRFVPQHIFHSREFATSLLLGHVSQLPRKWLSS